MASNKRDLCRCDRCNSKEYLYFRRGKLLCEFCLKELGNKITEKDLVYRRQLRLQKLGLLTTQENVDNG